MYLIILNALKVLHHMSGNMFCYPMDMYYSNGEWHEQKMLTPKRFEESSEIQKKHILNSYRVLLTRAKKGMIIYIPKAKDFEDSYGVAIFFDSTYEYLKSCGIKDISEKDNPFVSVTEAIKLPF